MIAQNAFSLDRDGERNSYVFINGVEGQIDELLHYQVELKHLSWRIDKIDNHWMMFLLCMKGQLFRESTNNHQAHMQLSHVF